jgi:hypothetical protein
MYINLHVPATVLLGLQLTMCVRWPPLNAVHSMALALLQEFKLMLLCSHIQDSVCKRTSLKGCQICISLFLLYIWERSSDCGFHSAGT